MAPKWGRTGPPTSGVMSCGPLRREGEEGALSGSRCSPNCKAQLATWGLPGDVVGGFLGARIFKVPGVGGEGSRGQGCQAGRGTWGLGPGTWTPGSIMGVVPS